MDFVARNLIQKHRRLSRGAATAFLAGLPADIQAQILAAAESHPDQIAETLDAICRSVPGPVPPGRFGPPWPMPGRPRPVVLRGFMNTALGNGPSNGMAALQKALAARGAEWPWFRVDCEPARADEMAWFWCWADTEELLDWDAAGRPYACGPNILFTCSSAPGRTLAERRIVASPHCRLLFTESLWYARLIRGHLGPASRARLAVWPYPIDPRPGPPLFPPKYELLIFSKGGPPALAGELAGRWPSSITLRYGQFRREELFEAARASRACAYLSTDDRGPLALAEVLLAGCPAAGIERGAPWAALPGLGRAVERLEAGPLSAAIEELLTWDRRAVAAAAATYWSEGRILDILLPALDAARRD